MKLIKQNNYGLKQYENRQNGNQTEYVHQDYQERCWQWSWHRFFNKRKENKTMNDFTKTNYYALFISIVKNETAKEALSDMGICPDNVKEEE